MNMLEVLNYVDSKNGDGEEVIMYIFKYVRKLTFFCQELFGLHFVFPNFKLQFQVPLTVQINIIISFD